MVVALLAAAWTHRLAQQDALRTNVQSTASLATRVVAPLVTDALVAGDATAYRGLDDVVLGRITDGSILRAKLWDSDGRILYSDELRLVGRRFPLGADSARSLRTGGSHAELSDLDAAENIFELGLDGARVEVYSGLVGADGHRYLFETYVPVARLRAAEDWLWHRLVPVAVVALGVLLALQLPLAVSLARRVERAHEQRRALLRQALTASARERLRLAQDLHDEVIPDLAGLGYALSATVAHAPDRMDPELHATMATAEGVLHRSLTRLRQIVLDVHPPRLENIDLVEVLRGLCEPLRLRGMRTGVMVDPDAPLTDVARHLLYRVARESLRNVEEHSEATEVQVRLEGRGAGVALDVIDDGVGFGWTPGERPRAGHDGLLLLKDAVEAAGGSFAVSSAPGLGCRITATLPG